MDRQPFANFQWLNLSPRSYTVPILALVSTLADPFVAELRNFRAGRIVFAPGSNTAPRE